MNLKHERESIIKFLYLYEMNELNFHDAVSNFNLASEEELSEVASEVAYNVVVNADEIDEIIEACLTNYSIKRLNLVDLQIIRLATYELMQGDLAAGIIIDEAINLSKEYSELDDFKSSKFNNRLLDNIKNYLNERK